MKITCARCPNEFETSRPDARFCSDRCRTAARRARAAGLPEAETPANDTAADEPGPIELALLADLEDGEATGSFDRALAAAALSAARECDRRPTGAMLKELRDLATKLESTRKTAADTSFDEMLAALQAPVEMPPQIPEGLDSVQQIQAKRAIRRAGMAES